MRNSARLIPFLLLIAFIASLAPASAQTEQEPPPASPAPAAEIPAARYAVRRVQFFISGITNEHLLRLKVDIAAGTEFTDLAAFERFLEERRQRLVNERVLAKVEATYSVLPDGPDRFFLDIVFRVTDSWNIVALPYFRYDTNDGLVTSVRGRDYNFLGSMQALVLNLDYALDMSGRHSYGGYTYLGSPFQIFSHDAGANASQTLLIHADGRPTTSNTSLSAYMVFREFGFPMTLQATQGLIFNPDQYWNDPDPYYLASSASVAGSIGTGWKVGDFGFLTYSPSVSLSRNWRLDQDVVRADRVGLYFSFSHGLSFGRIDWIENMRRGLSVSVSNTDGYNIDTASKVLDVDALVEYHATSAGLFGLNLRAKGFHSFSGTLRTELGSNMRGIKNSRLLGTSAAFINLDAPVKLFDFPTHIFITKNWFDFELQAAPFVDLGYCDPPTSVALADKFWYTAGLEFMVYPLRMRTFIVRASAGFDLDAVVKNISLGKSIIEPSSRDGAASYELYFGLGLFY